MSEQLYMALGHSKRSKAKRRGLKPLLLCRASKIKINYHRINQQRLVDYDSGLLEQVSLVILTVLIDIEAPIPNQIVTWPLINILRLIDLSTACRVWNWLQLAIDLCKVPVLIIIPIKAVEVYYNTVAIAILQVNRLVFI